MPTGRTHDIITAVTTPLVGFGTYFLIYDVADTLILTGAYIFASVMFNGDLDIKSTPYRRWSWIRWIWKPYQNIIPHRSIWSHGLIIGTIVRLIYLSPLILILGYVLGFRYEDIDWNIMLYILVGLEFGNSCHTISDVLSSL